MLGVDSKRKNIDGEFAKRIRSIVLLILGNQKVKEVKTEEKPSKYIVEWL